MSRLFTATLFALAFFGATACSNISAKQPSTAMMLTGRVVDEADLLSPVQEAALTARLARFEQATNHQFVVVTVPSLGGKDILFFTVDLARRWGIGRKGINDGIVLLVAPNEQKARIEVGYGLERLLPDEDCATIMREHIIPKFKDGKMVDGINAGTEAIIAAVLAKEQKAA